MSDLKTPVAMTDGFYNHDGPEMCGIVDDNGFHLFDCYMADAANIRNRINNYEKLQQQVTDLESDLDMAVARIKDMLMGDDGQAWKEAEKFLDWLEKAKTKNHQGE